MVQALEKYPVRLRLMQKQELKEQEKLAIIFGTESTGIKDDTILKSDYVTIIPMYNEVDSLNVAAAAALGIYSFRNT